MTTKLPTYISLNNIDKNDIKIDLLHDSLFDAFGLKTLNDRYMVNGETSPQQAFARVCAAFADDLPHAQRLYDYVSQHWFMFSTPILANGGTNRGLPISCFLMYAGDSRESLGAHFNENLWLSTEGGGVSGDWSDIRPLGSLAKGGTTVGGIIPHLKVMDAATISWKQGDVRKGSYAAYLDIDHPEIEEFVSMRSAHRTATLDRKCLNIHHGVNVSDKFMQLIEQCMINKDYDDSWPLINPQNGEVVKSISARVLWQELITIRMETGEPYFHFIDRANDKLPKWLKDQGLRINSSNLCLSGDQRLLTPNGYKTMNDLWLLGGSIDISDVINDKTGGKYVPNTSDIGAIEITNSLGTCAATNVYKTGTGVQMYAVEFKNGTTIRCTSNHRFVVEGEVKNALDLRPFDKVKIFIMLDHKSNTDTDRPDYTTVVSVTPAGIEDSYCLTVPINNEIVVNGVYTLNCNEIELPTSEDRTAVCCLSSVNAAQFDHWSKNETFIEDLMRMLDNVLTVFALNAPKELSKSVKSAISERSVGLGCLGFHTYLQEHDIAFESFQAASFNNRVFSLIGKQSLLASKKLAMEKGEAPDAKGYGLRFSHRLAVAPNASSAIICGNVSPSVEPFNTNGYVQKTLSGWNVKKNKSLIKKLEVYGKNNEEVWSSIVAKEGSVQHLKWMSDEDKKTFKTAFEIDQRWIIEHAVGRMAYIDQSQSLNLFFNPKAPIKYISDVHLLAWKSSVALHESNLASLESNDNPNNSLAYIKGLYYVRSDSTLKPAVTAYKFDAVAKQGDDECLACQG